MSRAGPQCLPAPRPPVPRISILSKTGRACYIDAAGSWVERTGRAAEREETRQPSSRLWAFLLSDSLDNRGRLRRQNLFDRLK